MMLEHKGYTGSADFDDEASLFHGEVLEGSGPAYLVSERSIKSR